MNFEDQLRAALRREPAPPGFAMRVMARASQGERPAAIAFWRRPAAWALAAALAVAAIAPPSVIEYQRHRRERGVEARRQLMVALRITNAKLRQTRERIQRATRHTL